MTRITRMGAHQQAVLRPIRVIRVISG